MTKSMDLSVRILCCVSVYVHFHIIVGSNTQNCSLLQKIMYCTHLTLSLNERHSIIIIIIFHYFSLLLLFFYGERLNSLVHLFNNKLHTLFSENTKIKYHSDLNTWANFMSAHGILKKKDKNMVSSVNSYIIRDLNI